MELFDTHCHIQSVGMNDGEENTRELWAKNPDLTVDKIIDNAHEVGISRMLSVGCSLDDSILATKFALEHANIWSSVGIHPHEAHSHNNEQSLSQFAELTNMQKVVAIGECGLDYFYEHSPKEDQVKLLKFQIELALKSNLPIIFHVRDAFTDFWPIFDSYQGIKGVIHSFTGSSEDLGEIIKRRLYVGLNGIVTFTKKPEQLEVFKEVPINNLILETDAPYLTPTPYRGTICEPKHVRVTAEFLANLRFEDLEEIARVTTNNACNLFGLKEE